MKRFKTKVELLKTSAQLTTTPMKQTDVETELLYFTRETETNRCKTNVKRFKTNVKLFKPEVKLFRTNVKRFKTTMKRVDADRAAPKAVPN